MKLFADDTSLFSVVQNKNDSASHSLTMISIKLVNGLIHGKCPLIHIPQNKQKNYFSGKCTEEDYPPIYFNKMRVTQTTI